MRGAAVVFLTDEFDQVGIRHDALVHSDGEGLSVHLGIFHRDDDFERSVIQSAEALRHFPGVSQGAPVDVEPYVVAEARGFYYQRIAVPFSDGVTEPPGLRVAGR